MRRLRQLEKESTIEVGRRGPGAGYPGAQRSAGEKRVTTLGEASDGGGSNDYSSSVAASRLWADRDHAAHFPAGAGAKIAIA